MTCTVFTTRNAHTDKMKAGTIKFSRTTACFVEISIAAVDDGVTLAQQWFDCLNHCIHRFARWDHE